MCMASILDKISSTFCDCTSIIGKLTLPGIQYNVLLSTIYMGIILRLKILLPNESKPQCSLDIIARKGIDDRRRHILLSASCVVIFSTIIEEADTGKIHCTSLCLAFVCAVCLREISPSFSSRMCVFRLATIQSHECTQSCRAVFFGWVFIPFCFPPLLCCGCGHAYFVAACQVK